MKKILVPTDFSTCAGNAVDFAVHLARVMSAEIILIHAFEVKGSVYTDYMGVNKEFNQLLLNDLEQKLHQSKVSIEEANAFSVGVRLFEGTVEEAVNETSIAENIDLVIMGTLGASGLKEKIWGSKTASVIGSAPIPVMAIPYGFQRHDLKKFLIATSFFEKDPAILHYVLELADAFTAQVNVAVFTDEDDDEVAKRLENIRKLTEYELSLKQQFGNRNITTTHLYGLEFEEALHGYIRENHIDVLVMFPYQRGESLWDRIFSPSKTKMVSYHIGIPLLAIPAKYKRAQIN